MGWTELKLVLALLGLFSASTGMAQIRQCVVPASLPSYHEEGPTADQQRRVVSTTGYTYSLSWSPEHCRFRKASVNDGFQCGGDARFGFVLHGLWPDGNGPNAWPQYCRPAKLLPADLIKAQLCTTPSAQLIQHEWAKHGTCTTKDPSTFFAEGRAIFAGLRFPDMNALSRKPDLTVRDFTRAFTASNTGLNPQMIRVQVNKKGWLDEVHLCLDLDHKPHACPVDADGAAPTAPLKIWRGR